VSDGYVCLAVGIAHIADIIADIERGLAAAGKINKVA
jgi:O-acetylhomoserine (thiol)-lyase